MINELKFVDNGDDTCTFSIILDDQVTQQVVFDMPFEQLFMSMIAVAQHDGLETAAAEVGITDDITFVVPTDIESM